MKRYLLSLLLLLSIAVLHSQPTEQEKALVIRIQQAQIEGDDETFYKAEQEFMDLLEQNNDWTRYYNIWMNKVVYLVNQKHFYRAFTEIHLITEDINQRQKPEFLYIPNMALGQYYVGRGNAEAGEQYFLKALEQIDTINNPLATFNTYLFLAQSLSFTKPSQAMAYLDRLPSQLLASPMMKSGVLGYRCIIAYKQNDLASFDRYYEQYDSIRTNIPEQFNAANLLQVMICYYQRQGNYHQALAWCDSIDVPLVAAELRAKIYEQQGEWKKAYYETLLKDSLDHVGDTETLTEDLEELAHSIDLLQAEQDKVKLRRQQLLTVCVMSFIIIVLLIVIIYYRQKKNRRLHQQNEQLQEARKHLQEALAFSTAFVRTTQEQLKSPVNVLRGYARIFNNPNFSLTDEQRSQAFDNIYDSAKNVETLIEPVLKSFVTENNSLGNEQKQHCLEAIRSPLNTLIGMSKLIADDKEHLIAETDYMQMCDEISKSAHQVASATHELILFSANDESNPLDKTDNVSLNEEALSTLKGYDLRNRELDLQFKTTVDNSVVVATRHLALQELLFCLLANADKFATGGEVLMCCQQEPDSSYSITITYEGAPIAAADAEHLFEPFVQRSEKDYGIGLGLALARKLATRLAYNVDLDTSYQQGVRFVVSNIR